MEPLTIDVDAIDESGQEWQADLSREFLDSALRGEPPTEFHAGGAARARARLTKIGRSVLVQSRFTVPLEGQCKRCLKKVPLDEPIDLTLTYVAREAPVPESPRRAVHDRGEPEPAASFDRETADEEPYSGKTIDLAPALREQILLAVPPSPLCDEECKGLCPTCGKDLNAGDCGCERTTLDPRWAALKSIQLEKKEK
ncbi:MAG: YceD family protein [Myxococcales bacterium]